MKLPSKYILIFALLVSVHTSAATLLDTLIGGEDGTGKACSFIYDGKYMPFTEDVGSVPLFGKLVSGGCVDVTQNVANMFETGFKVFLGIVSLIAVVNIAVAGIQYIFQEQSPGSKSKAKKRLTSSIIGLILAFSSWVILNTVNSKLTDVGFDLRNNPLSALIQKGAAGVVNLVEVQGECIQGTVCGASDVAQGNGAGTPGGAASGGNTTNPPTQYPADMAAAQKMNLAAQALVGKKTCDIKGTEGGTLACAFVVNDIVNQALGKPITGSADAEDTYGRSTIEMKKDLDSSSKFFLAGTDVSQLQPGDIIISPTVGDNAGHVGVYTSTGKIISNSTSKTEVNDHHTPTSWTNYYNGTKNLTTYIYRPRAQ